MIYLSNFKTAGHDDRAVSIARTARGFKGEKRPDLAPSQQTLTDFKNNKITLMQLVFEYMDKIYTTVDFEEEAERLDGKILLCWCDKQKICHRALFGMFLHAETGIEVEEIGGYGDWFSRILDEIKEGKGYPADWDLDKETIEFLDLKNVTSGGLIGHWKELNDRGMLFLYQDDWTVNDYPDEYYQKYVDKFLKENNLTLEELYALSDLSREKNMSVEELVKSMKKG